MPVDLSFPLAIKMTKKRKTTTLGTMEAPTMETTAIQTATKMTILKLKLPSSASS